MGKRIELTTTYRPLVVRKISGQYRKVTFEDKMNLATLAASADEILAHKRAQKAAQMRRYRAKKAKK